MSTSTSTTKDRVLPRSLEAEKGLLGSMMLDPRVIDDVVLTVKAEHFYPPSHKIIFAAIKGLNDRNKFIDITLLVENLKSSRDLEAIGGVSYLMEIAESQPTAANAVWYAEIVREKAIARRVIEITSDVQRAAYDEDGDSRELLARAQDALAEVAEGRSASELVTTSEAVTAAVEAFAERSDNGVPTGLDSGWPMVDRYLGGLRAGELIIVAARPGVGKTSWALNLADHVASEGAHVLFVSLEMTRRELGERLLSSRSGVPLGVIRRGSKNVDNRRAIIEAQADLAPLPITFDDAPQRSMADIAAAARRVKRQGKLALIVIDYLQMIEPADRRSPRHEQVATISRRLKTLPRELRVPIVCLAQLNRDVEKAADHRPRLSHLRESAQIEADADVVLFVHREELFRPDDPDLRGRAELVIAKQRNGETGSVPLRWNGVTTTFLSIDESEDQDSESQGFIFT
ncbi:MAG: replicative DNA helicase [Planctomycetia bacterium]|nr:replicative DNA helicase [Planctomycetia bacterium]